MIAPVDITSVVLETERLILRPWQQADLRDFYEYASVPGVGERAGWPHHETMEDSQRILNSFIAHKKTFALVYKENNKVIGSLGLEDRDDDDYAHLSGREIGYVLSKDYWGRGLMVEAVKAVMAYCFRQLNYDILTCSHFAGNYQSKRVIEKAGFQFLKEIEFETRMHTMEHTCLYVAFPPKEME